jgi:hypothetical protein
MVTVIYTRKLRLMHLEQPIRLFSLVSGYNLINMRCSVRMRRDIRQYSQSGTLPHHTKLVFADIIL